MAWWMRLRGYALALAAIALAAVIRSYVHWQFGESIPYTPFYPAIVIAALYGGRNEGLFAASVAAFAASFWLDPFGKPLIEEFTDLIGMGLFVGVSLLLVGVCDAMRTAKENADRLAREQQQALQRECRARCEAEEANRLKDVFLASVSHELRTPLQAILGWAELLCHDDLSPHDRAEGLDIIGKNARAQSRLVNDLLDMSRISSGKMQLTPSLIDLRDPVQAAVRTVSLSAQARGVSIECSLGEEKLIVLGDTDRLQQVAWNLLSNAIKFSPSGTMIRVELRTLGDEIALQVIDQGDGIDPVLLPHVFDVFRQADGTSARRHGGLGLGLAIVKHLVELHGGGVAAHSEGLGKGTTMSVRLPLVRAGEGEGISRSGGDRQALKGVRVLVVEDDLDTCQLIRRILEERDADVLIANAADAAVELAHELRPHVIVSDIGLPQSDGYEMLRTIHRGERDRPKTPAMALTAYSTPDARRKAKEAGYEIHLTKPVEAGALTAALAQLMSGPAGRRER